MARRQEQLVRAIRARRRAIARSVRARVAPLDPVRESVRRHPAAWAMGGALVGMVTARAFGARLVRGGRRLAGAWVEQRLGDVILSVAMKAAASVRAETPTPGASNGKARGAAARATRSALAATQPDESQSFSGS